MTCFEISQILGFKSAKKQKQKHDHPVLYSSMERYGKTENTVDPQVLLL